MAKYVMGKYDNMQDAKDMVNKLTGEGYPMESISVMADRSMVTNIDDLGVAVEDDSLYAGADESTWQRIKNFFGRGDYDEATASAHSRDLRDGYIFVMADCDMVPDDLTPHAEQQDTGYWNDARRAGEDETIRLQEEQLHVDKQNVSAGEVTLKKRVVEETRSIDVPVEHEELVIERRPVSDRVAGDADFGEDVITIPLMEEEVRVTKEPVVTEEVRVKKRDVTDNKRYSASVRREELDVDKSGHVVLENSPSQNSGASPM